MSRTKTPTDTFPRVLRGGSWYDTSATNVRAAYRNGVAPSFRYDLIGFRLTQSGCRQHLDRA